MIVEGQACCQKGQPMDIQEILQQLTTNTGTFPREALTHAIAQREEIIPALLRVLAEAQHNIEHLIESDSMAHIYAMYLLAQFREPRAYPLIVAVLLHPWGHRLGYDRGCGDRGPGAYSGVGLLWGYPSDDRFGRKRTRQ